MNPPVIETKSLRLVAQTPEAVRAFVAQMSLSDRAQLSPDWLARLNAPIPDPWILGFAVRLRETDAPAGNCAFKAPPSADGMVEIAYMIEPEHQGRGYATEAAAALTDYAFRTGDVRTVRAHTMPEKNASTCVLTKCGFTHLGEVTDPEDGLVWRWEKQKPSPA